MKQEVGSKRSWRGRRCCDLDAVRGPFAFMTITILSLLVPLSFLLLARFSCDSYLLSFAATSDHARWSGGGDNASASASPTVSFFRCTNPFLVQVLVSIISLAALFHSMTGRSIIQDEPKGLWFRPRLYAAWIFLSTLQVCVGLGIECSVHAGRCKVELGNEIGLLSRVVFLLGLHEAMVHWSRSVVKPVVDDTVFGGLMEERLMQKVASAAGCGWLWWWRLRDEVENLVVVAEIKHQLGMSVGPGDFISWWLYYLIVTIGLVRLVRSFIWVSMSLCCRSHMRVNASSSSHIEPDEKV
uniref:Transmembrane protein n=1 Tax=Kalanchoe fedtschenkoi TaxID=63787 RepID=A0A7N0ZX82_KALFE